jgi:signal transduction histidine kinase
LFCGNAGLRLAISRHYCELVRGMIGVESRPGKGSVFTVRLPADAAQTALQGPARADRD